MSQTKDLRLRTTVADTPDAGVARIYANASGMLKVVLPSAAVYDAAAFYDTTNANSVVTLTSGTLRDGASAALSSGYFYGTTGTRIINTALGEPNRWISVNISGATYSIPAYTRT